MTRKLYRMLLMIILPNPLKIMINAIVMMKTSLMIKVSLLSFIKNQWINNTYMFVTLIDEQLEMHYRGEIMDCEVNETTSEDDGDDDTMGLDQPFHEALQNIPSIPDLDIPIRPNDEVEEDTVTGFMDTGCNCTMWKGKSCSLQFSKAEIDNVRSSCWALSHTDLDMVVLGQIMATSCWSDVTDASYGHTPRPRKHNYMKYFHQGKSICSTMFRFLHTIGEKRLKNLVRSFKANGLAPRVHGNTKRLPHNTLPLSSVEYVVRFLLNFADQNCLLLPGRIPGYSRSDIKLLPSSLSKRSVWKKYHESADSADMIQPVSYSSFCSLWRSLLPSIVMMKPMLDLCFECQKNSTAIVRAANCPDTEKSVALKNAEDHLRIVHLERSFYKSTVDECRRIVHDHFMQNGSFVAPELSSKIAPSSKPITVHYSFDFAQGIHYPSDPLQPGPIYFLTPRKCSVFGVHCEALPRQVNFLIDEAGDCGKGANSVVSMLHFFFGEHGLGEQEVFLHADNCTGQNKNSTMMQYLLWRCLTGRHKRITISFLVVGHTKFAPDWCFGLFKRLFRRSKVGTLSGVADIVEKSAKCNFAQLVCSEDGEVIVPVFNWTSFFCNQV